MDEVFDYIPLIGDLYRGWRIGNRIASFFSNNDETDAALTMMVQMINSAVEEEDIENKINIIDGVFKLSDKISCQYKYQQSIMGYVLIMGGYIGAICYWQSNLWNEDAHKVLNEYFNNILDGCSEILNINVTWFTDNGELVKDVQSRVRDISTQVRKTKREMQKHYRHVDKVRHPWKYRLVWIIPLVLLLFTGWGFVCYYYL